MVCPNMVSREKAPQWLRVVSLLMMGAVVVRCSYSYGEELPHKKNDDRSILSYTYLSGRRRSDEADLVRRTEASCQNSKRIYIYLS